MFQTTDEQQKMCKRWQELRANTLKDNGKPMTQKEVAEKIGCDEATYNQWEKGKTPIQKIEYAKKLCELFGVSMDYLLGISDYRRNENENICQELGLSEKAVDRIKGEVIRIDDGGSFINHEIDNGLLNFILESDHGISLLNGIDKYLQTTKGNNSIIINGGITLTDIDIDSFFDTLKEQGIDRELYEQVSNEIVPFSELGKLLERSAKDQIDNELYELKKEYKEREGKDGK